MNPIRTFLAQKRYETARREGVRRLKQEPSFENVEALHEAYTRLSDFTQARDLLLQYLPQFPEHRKEILRRLAAIYQTMAAENHYRRSDEAKQGFSCDEYIQKYRDLARQIRDEVEQPASPAIEIPPEAAPPPLRTDSSRLIGRICDEAGRPLCGVELMLGLESPPLVWDERDTVGIGYEPKLPKMEIRSCRSDASGHFCFDALPGGVHDYLAVRLDPAIHPIATRFIAKAIAVPPEGCLDLGDLYAAEWVSVPAAKIDLPKPEGDLLATWAVENPFDYDFHRQPIRLPLPEGVDASEPMRVMTHEGPEAFQIIDRQLVLLTSLSAHSRLEVHLWRGDEGLPASPLRWVDEGECWVIQTGSADYRIAGNVGPRQPPILAMKGSDGLWRGEGRFRLPEGISLEGGRTVLLESGPVCLKILIESHFSNGQSYRLEVTAYAGEPLLLVRETSAALEGGAFEFSLSEFNGGRGYLHWHRECGGFHWSDLKAEDELKASLEEQVPWWIPPHGFGYAVTHDRPGSDDYLGLFSVRRGEWIDPEFARLSHGPIDREGNAAPELDWPYPEMVGSSISAISVATTKDADVVFRFGLFEGQRQWALFASRFSENDGQHKKISALQHAYTVPRLDDFRQWRLDLPDQMERPSVIVRRSDLLSLRAKARRYPALWQMISENRVEGAADGMRFAIEGDPKVAWQKRCTLLAVAKVRSRATLLGRDWSDMYSPVGGRPITHWAQEYDLIASSGVFSEDEEQLIRSFFLLMGHLFMEKDFMNWNFNARNANFEADRVEIVGTIGLVFAGHASSERLIAHATERLSTLLPVYCNAESGKWYENPACYYRVACRSWSTLALHLARLGRVRLSEIPRLREFLRWGITLLTPPLPSYEVMRAGTSADFEAAERFRKVPPIGDHAALGHWLMGHYYAIAKAFAEEDPDFSQELLSAFYAANPYAARILQGEWPPAQGYGGDFGHPFHPIIEAGTLLFFIDLEEEHAVPSLPLQSQRLSGFGAVLRNRVNTPQEDYLLIKQGPGGYRYHRTEGSFLYIAEGRPLIYDGGEAGETWRHSTLSFGEVQMPIAAGRVERYFADPAFHFVEGVHPQAIRPGEPVFLSDLCDHRLVEECYRRFENRTPALVRTFAWVGSDYLIVADRLAADAPSHWHLQVVADQCEALSNQEYHFSGRHGVDLQVLFPDQAPTLELLEPLPVFEYHGSPEEWFSMMHLQVADPSEQGYLALLRPLSARQPDRLTAERLIDDHGRAIGIAVKGREIDDRLWLGQGDRVNAPGFSGTSGALLLRPEQCSIWLSGEGELRWNGSRITAEGAIANLFYHSTAAGHTLRAEGHGVVTLHLKGKRPYQKGCNGTFEHHWSDTQDAEHKSV